MSEEVAKDQDLVAQQAALIATLRLKAVQLAGQPHQDASTFAATRFSGFALHHGALGAAVHDLFTQHK